ncbi:MAG: hypothetical protein ABW168_08970 [Sedimenticola sp.]
MTNISVIKVVISTLSVTFATLAVAGTVFLNSILGMFDLALTSAESVQTINELKNSKQIVERMKTRNKDRKDAVPGKFLKRTGTKIASSAAAAATIGTAAVVVTVAAFEVESYCDDKKELHEDGNILNSTSDEFDYETCAKEATADTKRLMSSVKDSVTGSVADAWESTKDYTAESMTGVEESSSETWEKTKKSLKSWW